MPIVGFNFTKINVERGDITKGDVKVSNNIQLKDVKEIKLKVASEKQKTVQMDFEYTAKYEPKLGEIVLEGHVILIEEAKKAKEIEKTWKKSKKIPEDIIQPVMNSILNRCTIEAIILSREVNLPNPVPLPKIQARKKAEDYVG